MMKTILRNAGPFAALALGLILASCQAPTQPAAETPAAKPVVVAPAAIPAAPTGVAAVAGNGSVRISWSPSTGATSYNVYFSSSVQSPTKTMAFYLGGSSTGVTSPYQATSASFITNGTKAYFVVTAVNSLGESVESAVVSATPSVTALVPTATDGLTWTSTDTLTGLNLTKLAVGGSLLVAAGGTKFDSVTSNTYSRVATSADGVTWTGRNVDGRVNNFNAVAWSGTKFVAVGAWGGDYGQTSTSTDGVTWTNGTVGGPTNVPSACNGLAWSPVVNLFVAVGSGIATSPDGITWTNRNAATKLNDVVWAGTQFVAVGDYDSTSKILTSPDGITWTRQTPVSTTKNLTGVAWSGSLLVVVGGQGAVWTSADGVTWADHSFGDPASHQFTAVAWSGTRFAATETLGSGLGPFVGVINTSSDGLSWAPSYVTASFASGSTYAIKDIEWTGTRFLAVGGSGMVYTGQ